MRILILGAEGFVGNNIKKVLENSGKHEIFGASNRAADETGTLQVDLLDRQTIAAALQAARPDVIINCAGIVDNSEKAKLNPVFTANLLQVALASGLTFNKIIISGSAAEYGVVDKSDIPVHEDVALNPNTIYGNSKLEETKIALDFKYNHKLPIVIVRLFNPIGSGMHPKFLIPSIMKQVREIEAGKAETIKVSALSPRRDYVNVKDVAGAIERLADVEPRETIYNIGSGRSTSNGELIEIILKNSKLVTRPAIEETSTTEEPLVAIQADISRISHELGWKPVRTMEDTIKEIMYATER